MEVSVIYATNNNKIIYERKFTIIDKIENKETNVTTEDLSETCKHFNKNMDIKK